MATKTDDKKRKSSVSKMKLSINETASPYTAKEVREAQIAAESIRRDLAMVGRVTFGVVSGMYEFSNKEFYARLTFETMDEWIESIGYAPSTYRKYMAVYKSLTKRLELPKEAYETLDVGKVVSLQRLAEKMDDAGIDKDTQIRLIVEHIEEAKGVTIGDLQTSTNEKIRDLTGEDPEEVKDPRDKLKPNVYTLVPITKEERKADPRLHANSMIQVKKVIHKIWFEPSLEKFVLEVS